MEQELLPFQNGSCCSFSKITWFYIVNSLLRYLISSIKRFSACFLEGYILFMSPVYIYQYWGPAQLSNQVTFVLFNSNTTSVAYSFGTPEITPVSFEGFMFLYVSVQCFVDHCLSSCPFSVGHGIVCSSFIMVSDYPCGIFIFFIAWSSTMCMLFWYQSDIPRCTLVFDVGIQTYFVCLLTLDIR